VLPQSKSHGNSDEAKHNRDVSTVPNSLLPKAREVEEYYFHKRQMATCNSRWWQ